MDNDPTPNTETEHLICTMSAPNLTYVKNEKNLGGYNNWSKGFQMAQTEWVCLLHDDDLLLPTCIERAYCILDQFETPRLGAVLAWQCNMFDNPTEDIIENKEKTKNWKARLDSALHLKTAGHLWKVGLFDNYMICSAYPALSGGNLIRRSAVLALGGFGTKYPCEDIFLMNRMAQIYDCYLLGEQWGWYRFGENNMWAYPADLAKWDAAKRLFREKAAQYKKSCNLYHYLFGDAMCVFDMQESVRFAARRGHAVDADSYPWLKIMHVSKIKVRVCRFNRNFWNIWISVRAILFGRKVPTTKSQILK